MATIADLIPDSMTFETALSMALVILVLTAGVACLLWLFAHLTPGRRQDVIRLIKALRQGGTGPR
ncbi:hypothetical protein V6K52_03495 [Knoellia sp. S7-12]|uniref:hypothetical protein n=1 Tax=Knoellia sp. S7-12 TaxID=3126698 RepID=UPI003366C858